MLLFLLDNERISFQEIITFELMVSSLQPLCTKLCTSLYSLEVVTNSLEVNIKRSIRKLHLSTTHASNASSCRSWVSIRKTSHISVQILLSKKIQLHIKKTHTLNSPTNQLNYHLRKFAAAISVTILLELLIFRYQRKPLHVSQQVFTEQHLKQMYVHILEKNKTN